MCVVLVVLQAAWLLWEGLETQERADRLTAPLLFSDPPFACVAWAERGLDLGRTPLRIQVPGGARLVLERGGYSGTYRVPEAGPRHGDVVVLGANIPVVSPLLHRYPLFTLAGMVVLVHALRRRRRAENDASASSEEKGDTLRDWMQARRRTVREKIEIMVSILDAFGSPVADGERGGSLTADRIRVSPQGRVLVVPSRGTARSALMPARSGGTEATVAGEVATRQRDCTEVTLEGAPTLQREGADDSELERVPTADQIYSVGCVLFEVLHGHPPGPSSGPRSRCSDVPSALDAVVARMLDRLGAEPFRSLQDAREALRDLLQEPSRRQEPPPS